MKLLVTGGLGFIGSNFIRHALSRHRAWKVVNLDLATYAGNPRSLDDLAGDRRYRWVKGNIIDAAVVERCMDGVDAVVHFAAESHVDRSILDASIFLQTNVIGTHVLLEAARRKGVKRFVHVSTDEVYGSIPAGRYADEDHALAPNSPYAASKAASDLVARSYFVTHGFPVIVTRASNNFGPYQFPEKALPLLITNMMDGLPFPLYGDGLQVRDWLYVLDHARAIDLVLQKGEPGEVYNVGGTLSCTNRKLIERVLKLMGKGWEAVRPVADRPGHDRRYALTCEKLRSLGFKHQFPFEEALSSTIQWYKENEAWWRPLKKAGGYKSYYDAQYARRLAHSR